MLARITLTQNLRRGDACEVKLSLLHPMETGMRRREDGVLVPRNVIESLAISFEGTPLVTLDEAAGLSANPYVAFSFVPPREGMLRVAWLDTSGASGDTQAEIRFAA
jgi:sulfur-oxidizing protein SoxZ